MMIEVVGTHVDLLGECPLWDGRREQLYTIDIDGRSINRLDVGSGAAEQRSIAGRPGSIALTHDPDIVLVAAERDVGWLHWPSGVMTPWHSVDTGGSRNRLNDGALDRQGRFWVGSMHEDATESTGRIYRIDPNAEPTLDRGAAGVPNGFAFSPDGSTMYYADSLAKRVWAYDYDTATGTRSRERVFNDFADLPGTADGATVDVDGCYWIACVFGSAIARLTPDGDIDRIVEVPVDKPTKPAFGGNALDTMFVTSIGGGASHPRYDEPGLNGLLLALDVGVSGVPEPIMELPES